jgi:Helix-hairpin-helix motif
MDALKYLAGAAQVAPSTRVAQFASYSRMRVSSALFASIAIACLLLIAGCSACSTQPSNPEQVRQATANATSELKNDTKAVAEGVRDGLTRPSPDHPINLNTATQSQLTTLPGISDETAARIVANRPYRSAHDLIDRRLVTPDEYKQIADRITAK